MYAGGLCYDYDYDAKSLVLLFSLSVVSAYLREALYRRHVMAYAAPSIFDFGYAVTRSETSRYLFAW